MGCGRGNGLKKAFAKVHSGASGRLNSGLNGRAVGSEQEASSGRAPKTESQTMKSKQVRAARIKRTKSKGARGAGRGDGQQGAAVGSGAAARAFAFINQAAVERRRLARLALDHVERARAALRRAGLAAPLLLPAPGRESVGGIYGLVAAGVLGSSRIGDVTGAGTGGAAASAGVSALGVPLKFRRWRGEGWDKAAAAADELAALRGADRAPWWVAELAERPSRRLAEVLLMAADEAGGLNRALGARLGAARTTDEAVLALRDFRVEVLRAESARAAASENRRAGYAQWWSVAADELAGRRMLAAADRAARRAARYSFAHRAERRSSVHVAGRPKWVSGEGAGAWAAGVEAVTTEGVRWVGRGLDPSDSSVDEARAEAAAALAAVVHVCWGVRGADGVNWACVKVRRFLGQVAWRAARRSLTELGDGFTGRRDAGARWAVAAVSSGAVAANDIELESLRRWADDGGGALDPAAVMPRFSTQDEARRASCAWVWRTLTRQPMPERGAAAARARSAARARARFMMRMISGDALGAAAVGAGFASAGAALASIKAGRSLELLAAAADGNGGWQRALRVELRAAGLAAARAVRMSRLALAGVAAGGELGAALAERGRAVGWARELRARVNGASSLWRARARDNGGLRAALRGAWGLSS